MPLWIIYHPRSIFTSEAEKTAFSKDVTNIYTAVPLPAFYVNVLFVPLDATNIYVGSVPRPTPHTAANEPGPDSSVPFVRITIQNIARTLPNDAARDRFLGAIDKALKPHIADKGYDWEYSVEETRRDLWKIQGIVPPMPGSDAELQWTRENKATAFEPARGNL
ncbi:hypothetical protein P171DRAFT_523627 [Karstenula rhodostoma CBS 690.94]|uniref:Tautomerase cis-CaaD-like domain-containing protein n=1 Tax=Karstenula rhodostoma CBS 690.94 TaxID=1392251 RepID=A0A9P4PE38_9PLEO|nr:hypothetical protein P171DRAFT_523627 [Karstenula rhodostoma CBS 690.94]